MKDTIEVFDAKITIRSSLSFLTDVKNKFEEPGNDKRHTLFRATVFGKWLDLPSFSYDNLLFNYIFQHQVSVDSRDDCPLLQNRICGNSLITSFMFGKLPKEETYKGISSSPFLDRIFPDRSTNPVKKVKGDELLKLFTTDDLWFGIFDHDVVRVCLLLVATIVFMGREPRTLNVVPRKNERDSKKNKEIVVEPPKKKKKVDKSSKKNKKAEEEAPKKMITYNLYGFVWSLKIYILEIFTNSKYWWKKDLVVIPCGISWSIIEKFRKGDYSRLFAPWSNPILTFAPSDNESVQPWCIRSFEYFSNHDESVPRDGVGVVLVEVLELEQKLICSGGVTAEEQVQVVLNIQYDVHGEDQNSPYPNMDKDSNICSDVHVEDQNSAYPNMDKDSNILSDVHVEDQNSPYTNMDKEHLLAEFDGIKATVHIIDKRKGDVGNSSEDSVKQVCDKPHELVGSKSDSAVSDVCHQDVGSEKHDFPGEGSSFIYTESQDKYSVSQLLQLASNEKSGPVVDSTQLEVDNQIDWGMLVLIICWIPDDNVEEGLVKLVDMLSMEENILECKLDEKEDAELEVDRATGQASTPLTSTEVQHVDLVQSAQNPPLIDNVELKSDDDESCYGVVLTKPKLLP
ncbi:hypothetical protein Tco_1108672 [Tanacetum coccineum]